MLFTFPNTRVGLFVGIGDGIPDHENHRDIRLGDVIIGSDDETGGVVTHDFGKVISDGIFYAIPALNRPPEALSSALMKMKPAHQMQGNKAMKYIEQMLDKYPRLRNNGYCHPGPSFDRLFQSTVRCSLRNYFIWQYGREGLIIKHFLSRFTKCYRFLLARLHMDQLMG